MEYGTLRLGMTKAQAVAIGLLGPFDDSFCSQAFLRDAPAGWGRVYASPERGLSAIEAWSTLDTAEGLHKGERAGDAAAAGR
ncbi:hypothetical protein AB0K00_13725 [Dactylosporangium sp. NPDC049525]|uniref:hypothetical protein n=1 Tax=Dactylosporangium sp. NPDC049525 TaxID=3154730 RepID=UPI003429EF0C